MSSVAEQVCAARNAVLVIADADLVALEVTGKDRLSWLNGLLTCDLAHAKPGDAIYGLAVAQKGRILSDVSVLVGEDDARMLVQRRVAPSLAATFDRHLMMEDAELRPAFDEVLVAWAHGRRSSELLAAAIGAGARGGSLDLTGLGGAVISWSTKDDAAVRAAIDAALAPLGGLRGDAAGWDALRLERAVPRFEKDFDESTYPQEAGLEKTAVSFSKGCYLGQEVVCMLQMRGHVKRKLAALVLDGEAVPARGARVTDGATDVGEVTSAAASPTLGKPVALAMVKFAVAEADKPLAVDGHAARIAALPA